MENITRTIYGSYLQTCMLLKLPFSIQAHTTLNEKFGIQPDTLPDVSTLPSMRYFAIGDGGHRMAVGANGRTKPEPIQHRATDAALFNHLPFVLRDIDNDLSVTERANYALRRKETHNGKQYIAYYLKRISFSNVVAGEEYISMQNGNAVVTNFVADSSNLNPVPPELSSSGVNVVTGDYVAATAKLGLALNAGDLAELLNVASVLYDDEASAIISEVALCSGVDKVVPSPAVGNTTINMNEAIAVQVVSHVNTFIMAKFTNNAAEVLLDVGATEPLFALQ